MRLACVCAFALPAASLRAAVFAKGADVGWLSQMEASGVQFYDASGSPQDCLQVLQRVGMNSIRLRVWVNPAGGWNGQTDVVNKAVRARNLGFRIMIDFHYSDTWADPGHQTKPAAWAAHGISQLTTDVYDHTTAVLNALKSAGVSVEWVQVGNETNDGMLWNDGRASTNMANFASLITSGYNAVKAVFPNAKVIVHISNGYDNVLFRWMFDGLTANGAKYDVIGMSLYPSTVNWAVSDSQCLANMNDMVARYGKEVMISEVGMDVNSAATAKAFLADIISKTRSVSGGPGLGVFYWEPEAYNAWQGYTLGAFGSNGRPTIALDAFKRAAPADLNGDGTTDLVWSNSANGARYVWAMDGGAVASSKFLGTVGTQWSASTGDFDGDGRADLLWSNTSSGDRYLWLMNGGTIVASKFLGSVAPQWSALTGDFDGDGRADLLWSNSASGDLYLWLMNGGTVTSSIFLGTVGTQWTPTTGDFNGDGQADLLWSNTVTGDRYLWLMSGGTVTASVFLGSIGTQWAPATGDFDGDGRSDILWSNTVTGDRYLWLMSGGTVTASFFLATVGIQWTAGIGDFNGDGQADLVWSNTATGDRYLWLMSGGTVKSSVFLGTVAPVWDLVP